MGGYPCQHFGALYPERVKGFVALDTTPLGLRYYSKADLWWLKRPHRLHARFRRRAALEHGPGRSPRTAIRYSKMMEMLAPAFKGGDCLAKHIA